MQTQAAKVWAYETTNGDEWKAYIAVMRSGERFEVDEEMFEYWLEVLPPVFMGRTVKFADGTEVRARFGFAEGEEEIVAFWKEGGRFFGRRTDQINHT